MVVIAHALARAKPRFVAAALVAAVFFTVAGCRLSQEQAAAPPAPSPTAAPSEAYAVNAAVPIEGYRALDAKQLEAERLDEAWRASAERDRLMREQGLLPASPAASPAPGATPAATAAAPIGTPALASGAAPIERMRSLVASAGGAAAAATPTATPTAKPTPTRAGAKTPSSRESWEGISPAAFETFEPRFPISREGGGPTVLAVQQMLDRVRFSPGAIDGRWGKNTEKAVYWLQVALGLAPSGTVDADLFARLRETAGTTSPLRQYAVTAADTEGPFVDIPDDYVKQADLDCLCYGSLSEELAERFHMTHDLLAKLNPDVDLDHLATGSELWVLDVEPLATDAKGRAAAKSAAAASSPIAEIVVSKDGFYVQALDANKQVLYHFPTTVGAGYDSSPS
ncbi:MAG TPA: peptidoglycan-binding domain-containing protein, partial [Thermoanaerobaculia bacterium]|nr:peptidoglycan-binding domain-containing protein [Thermoanaerobaculia bacterium]